jgi:hypothetical protein
MKGRNPILRGSMRSLLLATLLLLVAAPAAAAVPRIELDVTPRETRYQDVTRFTGTVTDGGMPVVGTEVVLEVLPYPFEGEFEELARTRTDAEGAFRFERRLDGNHAVRVLAAGVTSRRERAYVFPRPQLKFVALNPRVIRLTQRYRVPRGVELERPTRFYVGPRGEPTAPRAAVADVRRTGPGRFISTAVVRIPSAWEGRFRYASCFRYTPGSGMGDPSSTCPRRFRF